MATITSNGTGGGPATTGSSWSGGIAPGDSDLAIIADGDTITHASGTWTVGDGDPTHYAIRTAGTGGTGILNVTGGTLVLKSSILQGNANWTITGVPIIQFNCATNGTWKVSDDHNQANALLQITGTDNTNRATIDFTLSTGRMAFTGGNANLNGGRFQGQYVNLKGVKDSSNVGWYIWLTGGSPSVFLKDYSCDACGSFGGTLGNDHGTINVERGTWTNSPGNCLSQDFCRTGCVGTVTANDFDGPLGDASFGGRWAGATATYNLFRSGIWVLSNNVFSTFHDNVVVSPLTSEFTTIPAITLATERNYAHFHSQSGTMTNKHGFVMSAVLNRMRGWIIEPGDTDTAGDLVQMANDCIAEYNLVLPNKDGESAGSWISFLGDGTTLHNISRHNTRISSSNTGESGGITVGENYAGAADMLDAIESELVWSPHAAGAGYVYNRRNTDTVSDIVAAANIKKNGKWQLGTGNQGVIGYSDTNTQPPAAPMFSSTTGLGAGDIIAAPKFAASPNNTTWDHTGPMPRLTTWAVARGYSSQSAYNDRVADAYAALSADLVTRIPDLIDYVASGWKTTQALFQDAGEDGVTIGSEGYVAPSSGGTYRMDNRLMRPRRF